MTDSTSNPPPSTTRPNANRGQRNRMETPRDSHPSATPKGPSQRGRGLGRPRGPGRAARGARSAAGSQLGGRAGEPPDRGRRGAGTSGDRLTGDANDCKGESLGKQKAAAAAAVAVGVVDGAVDDADESEICFICASKVEHVSVAPCNHRTCHICSLRLRALYKTKACAHCRAESSFVVFTNEFAKNYEEFTDADFIRSDDNLGVKYEKQDIFEDTVLLLRYNCPDKDCDVACLGWPDLHRHVKSKHGKVMCDLCTRNKKVFTHEHELFSQAQLRKHEKYGDDNPGALDQSGFKGHPECGFCRQRFYGDDELYTHCRDKHERCHICDRRTSSSRPQYYVDYGSLEEHFGKDHFLCLDKECLEKKFVVFESQMDLKAHQLENHPSDLSKDARRDARQVDMSTFDFRSPYQPQRGRRDGRRPLGRDPNAEPIPASSAQALRRDEIAYQRQLAVQSAQSISTRSFGGQLTQPTPAAAAAAPPQVSASQPPLIEHLNIDSPASTPQEQARRMAHSAVMDRAAGLLRNDTLKINDFRNKVSQYRTSKINANDLIESFFSLFDTSSSELGKLIKELAHLYEDESKCTALLTAWNDWRAINEDYPALPGPSGTLPSASADVGGGKRVLRLKSSTAPSSRSSMGQNARLPGLLNKNGPSNPFPSLPSSKPSKSKGASATRVWGTTPTPQSSTPKISPASSRPVSGTTTPAVRLANNSDAFPALPAAPKPNVLMAGLTRGTVRWDDRNGTRGAAWGAGGTNPTPAEADTGGEAGQKGKGKKGKGKQVLYHFG
ncbi:hypothetical protein LOZ61_003931 [Ophidiomyces ophidiicola]|uniref:Uncharacterized protein n=1 Tax=Ophidiomyces ophidiicola TaxID=1387563 RepID=A0ACB8UM94_9EURO|nr:hypothetical protein LOZ61_003931 [Ophidiomyces ophidiicola]KAI1921380.1 hypothetical protein LOZ60_006213 [Ophidiomyces ophidiicola]KAI2145059.1 hypothetical protein LOZ27_003438 [Ophidiomyces ophidiicola]KAI2149836.1 hypothetical protein LOZ25_006717 [Ophidiomyces ophidiicola]KAI2188017.1 hypothetical protein LOZ20_006221 [Ophidiomyces ophidiicola]